MGCWEGPSAGSLAYIITVLALLVFFGCTPSTSEPTESEESGLGNLHCPEVLTVGWNEDLFRPPYVTRTNNTTNDYEGLLPGKVFANFRSACFYAKSATRIQSSNIIDSFRDRIDRKRLDYSAVVL